MKNKCYNCGNCCLDTEMILSKEDIDLILKNSLNDLRKENFVFKNNNGYFQLKNIDHHCVFFDILSKTCKMYEIRPQGCRYYPLIYDYDKNKCIFDNNCPRTHLFYQNDLFKKRCKKLRLFLKNQLKINLR
ncbi:MAG: YkgJ family cysteine cluster protein [Promethearchaeota archaeon]